MNTLSSILQLVARFLCQGAESRSLVVCGEPFPLCVRCMAVYAGILLMTALLLGVPGLRRRKLPAAAHYAAYVGLGIMGIMGSIALFGEVDSPVWVRLVVGAIFGVSIAVLIKGRLTGMLAIPEKDSWRRIDLAVLCLAALSVVTGISIAAYAGNAARVALAVVSAVGCLLSAGGLTVVILLYVVERAGRALLSIRIQAS